MTEPLVIYELADHIATLTLNNPFPPPRLVQQRCWLS